MPTKPSKKAPSNSKSGPRASLPTGTLVLSGLTAFGYHGNNPAERKLGQTFSADIEVMLDTQRAATTDHLVDTLSYPVVERIARQILEGKPANLLETVAERIASALLKQPRVVQVTVRVTKRPPLANLAAFTVEITRPVEISNLPQ
ncbi:MAG: dihydroneopterin aldolase [Chloroflexi bacterium]|nr:MAG: dihydroneopterin aldolase [Chloroflexota bacterium]TME48443.1 MAG: dihydroneopterin aldolase [Chloroflexota bacterium]